MLKDTIVQAEGVSMLTIMDQLTTAGSKYPLKRDAQCQVSVDEEKGDCGAVDFIKVKPQLESPKTVSNDAFSSSRPMADCWVLTLQVLSTWGSKSHVGLTEVLLYLYLARVLDICQPLTSQGREFFSEGSRFAL